MDCHHLVSKSRGGEKADKKSQVCDVPYFAADSEIETRNAR